MEKIKTQIAQLKIFNEKESRSDLSLYRANPTPLENKNFGQLFIITDLYGKDKINQEIISLIESEIPFKYYGSDNFNVEIAFENALQDLNQKFQQLISERGDSWLANVNIIAAVLKDDKLFFSQVGNIKAYLIQNNNIIDIVESSSSSAQKNGTSINPLKILANVISGQLNPKGHIFLCTSSLLDYLSLEKIKKSIIDNPPKETIAYLEKLLFENTTQTTFGAILLSLEPESALRKIEEKTSTQVTQTQPSDDSMTQLVNKEENTSELLRPSLLSLISKSFRFMLNQGNNQKTGKKTVKKENRQMIEQLLPQTRVMERNQKYYKRPSAGQLLIRYLRSFFSLIKLILIKLLAIILFIIKSITLFTKDRRAFGEKIKKIPNQLTISLARGITRFKGLSTARKVLLVTSLVFIFLFIQSIINLNNRKQHKQQESEFSQIINDADAKINEAKAALIYENEEGAREFLLEAKDLLNKIPKNYNSYTINVVPLNDSIREQLNSLNGVQEVAEPQSIGDFQTIHPEIKLNYLISTKNNIYTLDQNNNSIYKLNLSDQSVNTTISNTSTEQPFVDAALITSGLIVARLGNDEIRIFDTGNQEIKNGKISFPSGDHEIKDLTSYADRIYTLDTKNNQIYKHLKDGDNYEQGVNWLTGESINLNQAVSLAVDGSIYLLTTTGQILKLYGGKLETTFTFEGLEPNLSAATKIYANDQTQNLYVLDPNNKRVVIITKDGKIKNQYFSEKFDNLKDISINEDSGKIYLLNSTKVFAVNLTSE